MANTHESAKRLVRETIDSALPDSRDELLDAIYERFPGGSGGVGHAQARTRREMLAVVDEVIADLKAERAEDTRAGYEARFENRHEAFDTYA